LPARPKESSRLRDAEDHTARQVELVERFVAKESGAVRGRPDIGVFLEHDDIPAAIGERLRG
jgi:hypothetical protein